MASRNKLILLGMLALVLTFLIRVLLTKPTLLMMMHSTSTAEMNLAAAQSKVLDQLQRLLNQERDQITQQDKLLRQHESLVYEITQQQQELRAALAKSQTKFTPDPKVWKDTITLEAVDLSCNPCLERARCAIAGELEDYHMDTLCARGRAVGVDPTTWTKSAEKFVLLTLFEPSKAENSRASLHNMATLLESADLYFPYQCDFFILADHTSHTEMRVLQAITHRRLVFVNVLPEFALAEAAKFPDKRARTRCQGDDTYRSMCRFASGPIFWMSVLDDYDFFIRVDEDAKFTSLVPTNLVNGLDEIDSGYGYLLEQTSSSQCRVGMNDTLVDFINQVDHDAMGRPWIRLGDFKFVSSPIPNNAWDFVDVSRFTKRPRVLEKDAAKGSFGWFPPSAKDASSPPPTLLSYWTYNCNFEVARLAYFRHPHYQRFWQYFNEGGLFFSTRMGDHEIKTLYMELFEDNEKVGCYLDLPYYRKPPMSLLLFAQTNTHVDHNMKNEWCAYNRVIPLYKNGAKPPHGARSVQTRQFRG